MKNLGTRGDHTSLRLVVRQYVTGTLINNKQE